MNKMCSKIFLVGILFASMPLCVIAQVKDKSQMKADADQIRERRFADLVQLEKFRKAGLTEDRSGVSAMIESLHSEDLPARTLTALHALAQLGEDRALPDIQSFIENVASTDQRNFARAAKARLVAEKYGRSIADVKIRRTAKATRFFQDLGMSPAELNADLVSYHASLRPIPVGVHRYSYSTGSIPPPAGVYAMRELADMLYRDGYPDYRELPEVMAVNFADTAAWVDAATTSGDVRCEIALEDRQTEDSRRVAGRIGDGSGTIKVRTISGDIALEQE